MNKFVLCADGFGKSKDYNRAVLNGCNNGFIRSCSIVANGEAFEAAINDILPECPNISAGINLNLTEGTPVSKCFKLTDVDNKFKYTYSQLNKQIKQNKDILEEIETEFIAQIEKVINYTPIYYINSVENIHIIPEILEIICKLALKYNIKYIRIPYEELYIVPDIKNIFTVKYAANILNLFKLNNASKKAKKTLQNKGLKFNDYIIGIGYKDLMNDKALEYGLKTLADEDNIIVECSIEPCSYLRNFNNARSNEFKMSQNKILEDTVRRLGFEITNHKNVLK